jgi:ABC-type molybdenum transport system ATPase subunit/photorepair protein PhrA
MLVARIRMFAGPNGSGKTGLIRQLQKTDLLLGPIVNADFILDRIKKSGFIDLKKFGLSEITENHWKADLNNVPELIS